MANLGFSSGGYYLNEKGGKTVPAGWVTEMHKQVLVDDGIATFRQVAADFQRKIDQYGVGMTEAQRKEREAAEERNAHREVVEALMGKYGYEPTYEGEGWVSTTEGLIHKIGTFPSPDRMDVMAATGALNYFKKN